MKNIIIIATILLVISSPSFASIDDALLHLGYGYGYGITTKAIGIDEGKSRAIGYLSCFAKECIDEGRGKLGVKGSYFDVLELLIGFAGVEAGLRAGDWALSINKNYIAVGRQF